MTYNLLKIEITMFIHDYKVKTEYFQAIIRKEKTFEIRKDDRESIPKVGHILRLREINSKRIIYAWVTYVLTSEEFEGIAESYFIMGIRELTTREIISLRIQEDSKYGSPFTN
jgi:hypothetical protein